MALQSVPQHSTPGITAWLQRNVGSHTPQTLRRHIVRCIEGGLFIIRDSWQSTHCMVCLHPLGPLEGMSFSMRVDFLCPEDSRAVKKFMRTEESTRTLLDASLMTPDEFTRCYPHLPLEIYWIVSEQDAKVCEQCHADLVCCISLKLSSVVGVAVNDKVFLSTKLKSILCAFPTSVYAEIA